MLSRQWHQTDYSHTSVVQVFPATFEHRTALDAEGSLLARRTSQANALTGAGDPFLGPPGASSSASCADLGPGADPVCTPAGIGIPIRAGNPVRTSPRCTFRLQGPHFIGSTPGVETSPSLSRLEFACCPRPASLWRTNSSSLFPTRLACRLSATRLDCCRRARPYRRRKIFPHGNSGGCGCPAPLPRTSGARYQRSGSKTEQVHSLQVFDHEHVVQTHSAR